MKALTWSWSQAEHTKEVAGSREIWCRKPWVSGTRAREFIQAECSSISSAWERTNATGQPWILSGSPVLLLQEANTRVREFRGEPWPDWGQVVLQHRCRLLWLERGHLPRLPFSQHLSTQGPADAITHSQGSCCSSRLAKQNQASFCYAPWIKWRWSLHMHLPRVQSWSKRCYYYFLDGKLWLSIILIFLTHVSLLWPLRDTEIAYKNTKKAKQMHVMMTWCCLLPKAIWHN